MSSANCLSRRVLLYYVAHLLRSSKMSHFFIKEYSMNRRIIKHTSRNKFASQTVLSVWRIEDVAIEEEVHYKVDDALLAIDNGLLGKTITGEQLINMSIGHKLTKLEQAKAFFLDYYKANGTAPSKTELTKSLVQDEEAAYCSALKYRMDKTFEVSLELNESDVKAVLDSMSSDLPKSLEPWIDREALEYVKNKIRDSFEQGSYYAKRDVLVRQLRTELDRCMDEGRLYIINGRPGTGKSTKAGDMAKKFKNPAIVCLSWTVCNSFEHKCPRITKYSCTKARYMFPDGKHDCIVFDETSQFGYETLSLILDILKGNRKATFIFMGDVDQIPTFISNGSFLYSIVKQYPECVEHRLEQFRYKNNPEYRGQMEAIVEGEIPENMQIFSLSEEIVRNSDCFITGSNVNVDLLNGLNLWIKHPELRTHMNISNGKNDLSQALLHANDPASIPVIASSTAKLCSGNDEYKIYRNTRYRFSHLIGDRYVLRDLVTNTDIRVSANQLNKFFSLAYAITVNRSQGLEWPRVCVYVGPEDRNLKNFNAIYVAVSRGMDSMILTTDKNGHFTRQDLINIIHKRYKFFNFFEDLDK